MGELDGVVIQSPFPEIWENVNGHGSVGVRGVFPHATMSKTTENFYQLLLKTNSHYKRLSGKGQ
jgi:hypothetical protein